jgi:hypothetical protein
LAGTPLLVRAFVSNTPTAKRRIAMKKTFAKVLTLTLLSVGLMSTARPSEAQTFLGNFCWKLDPFVDTLRISLISYPNGMYGAFVRWRAGTAYQFQGSGLLSPDSSTPGDFLLASSSAGTTANFSCDFQGKLGAATWSFQCPSTGFTNTGTLTFLAACPADAGPQEEGPTAMSPN